MSRQTQSLVVAALVGAACFSEVAPTRVDDPDNPPDTAIEGTVTVTNANVFLSGGRYHTNSTTVDLRITFAGAATKAAVLVFGDSAPNDVSSGDFTSQTRRTVELIEGQQYQFVQVLFRDAADHRGAAVRLDFELDDAAPTVNDHWIVTDHRPLDAAGNVYADCQGLPNSSADPVVDVYLDATDASTSLLQVRLKAVFGPCDAESITDADPQEIYTGVHRVLLSSTQGLQTVCAQVTDTAGNATDVITVGEVMFDRSAPTSPRISTGSAVVDAHSYAISFSQSVDAEDNFAGYEVYGGAGDSGGAGQDEFELCAACVIPADAGGSVSVDFNLVESGSDDEPVRVENIIRVRAVDCASNVSDDDFRFITEDSRTPNAPQNLRAIEDAGAVTLRWDPPLRPLDLDVAGYRIYYGTVSRDFSGTFAEAGPSPIDVGRVENFRLTGLPNGSTIFVTVTALDDTEWIQMADASATCREGQPSRQLGENWYCAEAHESAASQELAVRPDLITPEPVDGVTASGSWHRLNVSPDGRRLLVSAGNSVVPFLTDPTADALALRSNDADGGVITKVYFDAGDNNSIRSEGFTGDIAFAQTADVAYVANGNDGLLVISTPEEADTIGQCGADGDCRMRLLATLGNPANFSRHVETVHVGDEEMLVVGGDQGLQLFRLGSPTDSTVGPTSPEFVKTVLSSSSVRDMVWSDADELLYVSLFPAGIAVLQSDLRFDNLGTHPNPFCPGGFTGADGAPSCDIIDMERVSYPGVEGQAVREMLIVADRTFGIANLDLTAFLASPMDPPPAPEQLGFCEPGGCLRLIQPGTLRAIEVMPPYIFALGTAPAGFGVRFDGDDHDVVAAPVKENFIARGGVLEVVVAANEPYPDDGTLGQPVVQAKLDGDGGYGHSWQTFSTVADVAVVNRSLLVAQHNLGLKAYRIDEAEGMLTLNRSADLTPGSEESSCIRPGQVVGSARRLARTGSRLLVADGQAGAQVLSLADPARPVHELELPAGDWCSVTPDDLGETFDVASNGPFAFVAAANQGLRVFDLRPVVASAVPIVEPAPAHIQDWNPDLDSTLHDGVDPLPYPSNFVVRVASRRDRLWFVGFDSKRVPAGSEDPGDVRLKLFAWDVGAMHDVPTPFRGSGVTEPVNWSVAANEERFIDFEALVGEAITADDTEELHLDDLLSNLEVSGDFLYLGFDTEDEGAVVRLPTDPSRWPNAPTGGAPWPDFAEYYEYENAAPKQVRVRGRSVFVADANRGLVILDEADGEFQASLKPQGEALAVQVEGNLVYLGTTDGLQIIAADGDDAGNFELTPVGFIKTAAPVRDILLQGGLAYLATDEGGLKVVELLNAQRPTPFATAPYSEEDGSFTGTFSVSGMVAYLISEGLDFFSRLDNELLLVDLRSPDKAISAASTTTSSPGATHVNVDGETLYVSALSPPVADDPYEGLSGLGSNDWPAAASPIGAGDHGGAVVAGVNDADWFVVRTNDLDEETYLAVELRRQGDSGEIEGLAFVDADCDTPGAYDVDDDGVVTKDGAYVDDATFLSDELPPQWLFPSGDAGDDAGHCVFVLVVTPSPQAVEYRLRIDWPDYAACSTATFPGLDVYDMSAGNACDASEDVPPRLAAGLSQHRLCGPAFSGTDPELDAFRVLVPPADVVVLQVRATGAQRLRVAVDTDGSCPLVPDIVQDGDQPVQFVVLDNLAGATPKDFVVAVSARSAGHDGQPYFVDTFTGSDATADVFDGERVADEAVPVLPGRYTGLIVEENSVDQYGVQVRLGDGVCFSVRNDFEAIDNFNLRVHNASGEDVTAAFQPPAGAPIEAEEAFAELLCFDDFDPEVMVTADCDGGPCAGVLRVSVNNPNPFPVVYDLDALVVPSFQTNLVCGQAPCDPIDAAEPNQNPGDVSGDLHGRLPMVTSYVGPMFVHQNDPDFFKMTIEVGQRVKVLGQRQVTSTSEFNLRVLDQSGQVRVFPTLDGQFEDTVDFINDTANPLTWYLQVSNTGGEQSAPDYYSLEVTISDGGALRSQVEAYNATPFGLAPSGFSTAHAATADALASWGPYTYQLVHNAGTTLYITRFSDVDQGEFAPLDLDGGGAAPVVEGVFRFPDPPLPPFSMVAEGSRLFILENDTAHLWFVDASRPLAALGTFPSRRGPWQLLPHEASAVDGMALHGNKLFISSAARGRIFTIDVADIDSNSGIWYELLASPRPLILDEEPRGAPVLAYSESTNVAGALSLAGFRLVAGLVGVTQDGPKGVGTALFNVRDVLALPAGAAYDADFEPIVFSPTGATTVGAIQSQVVGPYMYISNENGFQVLDLR